MEDVKKPKSSQANSPHADDVKSEEQKAVPYSRFSEVVNERNSLREKMSLLEGVDKNLAELEKYKVVASDLANSELRGLAEIVGVEKFGEALETLGIDKLSPLEKLERLPKLKNFLSDTIGVRPKTTGGAPVLRSSGRPTRLEELKVKNKKAGLSLAERREYLRLLRKVK